MSEALFTRPVAARPLRLPVPRPAVRALAALVVLVAMAQEPVAEDPLRSEASAENLAHTASLQVSQPASLEVGSNDVSETAITSRQPEGAVGTQATLHPAESGPTLDPQEPALSGTAAARRIYRPVIPAAGIVEASGEPFRIAGIEATALDEQCGSEADAWPCGRMARTAVQRFIRGRAVECSAGPEGDALLDGAHCTVGGRDISKWLVTQGWARADGTRYAKAEEAARTVGRGIWSPTRPGFPSSPSPSPAGEIDAALLEAVVRVEVNLSAQSMTLTHRGAIVGQWPVSTARSGKVTPTGSWRAQWLSRNHRSSLYGNAPMPYSVFFNGDYAVHGTSETDQLGRPASAGCIRLHPEHAAVVFELAREEGLQNTVVVVRP